MKPCFLLLFGLLLTTLASLSATGPAKPKILLIFADDIGYAGPHHAKDGQTFCSVVRPDPAEFRSAMVVLTTKRSGGLLAV